MALILTSTSDRPVHRSAVARFITDLAPGLALTAATALAALALQRLEVRLCGHAWIESLVLAILAGALLRTVWAPPDVFKAGIDFAARTLLEVAVLLLGASVTVGTLMSVGWVLLFGVAGIVILAIAVGFGLGRALGLPHRMALLVACGNAICGNSAIAAVAPAIGADGEEVTAAVAFTAVLGVGAVLGLPLLSVTLHLPALQFGVLSGLTVYAVPQVLAATASAGPLAVQIGALVKLVRVLMLGPVCFVAACLGRRWALRDGADPGADRPARRSLLTLTPWFIIGFLGLAALRSLGALPSSTISFAGGTAGLLTVVSMAALGLSTNLRAVVAAGSRVAAAATLSLLALGGMSLGLIALIWG